MIEGGVNGDLAVRLWVAVIEQARWDSRRLKPDGTPRHPDAVQFLEELRQLAAHRRPSNAA